MKSTYAKKSTNNVYRMIESDPESIESGKKLNRARPIKHHHHLLKTPHRQHHRKHLKKHVVYLFIYFQFVYR